MAPAGFEAPCYSGRSESANRGTTKDTRKIGKSLFPVQRKETTWPSTPWNVRLRLRFRPSRTCNVCCPASTGSSIVSFMSTDPTRSPSTTTSYGPRRTSTPIALCVNLRVADIFTLHSAVRRLAEALRLPHLDALAWRCDRSESTSRLVSRPRRLALGALVGRYGLDGSHLAGDLRCDGLVLGSERQH